MHYNLITILGPTATGKTKLAAQLANEFNGEIISADSRQVYTGMDIGTGKDLNDYIINGKTIPYHLIDIIRPSDEFNLFLFKSRFNDAFENIEGNKKIPFLVGGTGLYLSAVLQNYKLKKVNFAINEFEELNKLNVNQLRDELLAHNSNLHNTSDLIDKDRIIKAIIIAKSKSNNVLDNGKIKSFTIGIRLPRQEIKKRITERLKTRLSAGMIEEVKFLLNNGITYERLNLFGLEYKYAGLYLKGELDYNDMFQKLNSAIHNFAKRQVTWFRKMEREGIEIYWIDGANFQKSKELIYSKIK
jgi:tRNA dimethylallyltransferase